MRIKTLLVLLYAALCASLATGCAAGRDRRDAPWDPRDGTQLMDQLPNWDRKSEAQCGGHLKPDQRKVGMTDRC